MNGLKYDVSWNHLPNASHTIYLGKNTWRAKFLKPYSCLKILLRIVRNKLRITSNIDIQPRRSFYELVIAACDLYCSTLMRINKEDISLVDSYVCFCGDVCTTWFLHGLFEQGCELHFFYYSLLQKYLGLFIYRCTNLALEAINLKIYC
jgi:hypothetical protein